MAGSNAPATDRRDAAVTAALAGAVLVILGYASGIGLRPAGEVSASAVPPQPAPTATPAPALTPLPVAEVPAPAAMTMPGAAPPAPMVSHPTAGPAVVATVSPSATPTATASAPTPAACPANALQPVVGTVSPLVGDLTSLLSGLTQALLGEGVPTHPAGDEATGVLGCTGGAR